MNFLQKFLSMMFLVLPFACANATAGDQCVPEAHFEAGAGFEVVDVTDVTPK